MTSLAIMQPYFFPYLGYFQLIASVDKFVLLDDVHMIRQGWVNRNNILLQGKAHLISIPVQKASQNKLICDLELVDSAMWREKMFKTLRQAYSKAPYFSDVEPLVASVLQFPNNSLSHFVLQSITSVAEYIGLKTKFVPSSSVYLNAYLKGQERIIDICLQEHAGSYINAIGGQDLYSKKAFSDKGISLQFVKMRSVDYQQFGANFVPSLSIIDVLMFNSREQIAGLLMEKDLL